VRRGVGPCGFFCVASLSQHLENFTQFAKCAQIFLKSRGQLLCGGDRLAACAPYRAAKLCFVRASSTANWRCVAVSPCPFGRRLFGGNLPVRSISSQPACSLRALHRYAIKHIGLSQCCVCLSHDDELALLNESIQHAGEAGMLPSSSGASTSSRMQNGLGRTM